MSTHYRKPDQIIQPWQFGHGETKATCLWLKGLPLLKPTFGAAFTVAEGESLKATMGDPNATPEEKMAQLDAFIEQKMRTIGTKRRELGIVTDEATPDTTTQEGPDTEPPAIAVDF